MLDGNRDLVDAVCKDIESAPIPDEEKALYRYVVTLNPAPAKCTQADVDEVKAAGWSEDAIFDAVTVCSIFNFFNRWIDGTGVPDIEDHFYEKRLEAQGDVGYSM